MKRLMPDFTAEIVTLTRAEASRISRVVGRWQPQLSPVSEDFMAAARRYLIDQRHVAASGEIVP
jgi:hypothetical protein